MKCEHIIELLSPYIDDMTNEKENMLIDAHLAQCPKCRQELEYLKLVTTSLGDLEHPQIPEQFMEDFHKCLIEEKASFFAAREFKRPKRSGWIAAGLAGIALTIGIYVSSLLPLDSFIAKLDDKAGEKDKPRLAIEEIIKSIKGKNTENNAVTPQVDIADTEQDEELLPPKEDNKQPTVEGDTPAKVAESEDKLPPTKPRFTKEYATKVTTADMDQSIDQLIQIAQANKLEYTLQANATNMQALSANKAKELNIKVERNKVQDLLKQLNKLGKVSSPVQNDIEITKEYAHIEEQIYTSNKLIKGLEQKAKLNEAEAQELEDLKAHLQESNRKKAQLDKKIDTVTVKVIIETEVTP